MAILEILGKIGFDWQVALANLVNFLIIFLILKKYAFKPIRATLNERQEKIDAGLAFTEQAKEQMSTADDEAQQLLKDAHQQARMIVTEAHQHGDSMVQKAEEDARTKSERILAQAEASVETERKNMHEQFQQHAAELISAGVEHVVSGTLTEKQTAQASQEALQALSSK